MSCGLRVTIPLPITDAVLTASTVPESDYSAWGSGETYALAARCIHAHKVWQSAADGNQGNEPGTSGAWLFVSATNRWKLFDLEQVTATAQPGGMSYTLEPDVPVNALHALSMHNIDSVRVRIYDRDAGDALVYDSGLKASGLTPQFADWWTYCFGPWVMVSQINFDDLPYVVSPRVEVDFVGGGEARVGCMLLGTSVAFGDKPRYGIQDGVAIETIRVVDFRDSEFQIPTMTKGATQKVAHLMVFTPQDELDDFNDFNDDNGANVAFYTISERWRTTQILGTVTQFRSRLENMIGQTQIEITGVPKQ